MKFVKVDERIFFSPSIPMLYMKHMISTGYFVDPNRGHCPQ